MSSNQEYQKLRKQYIKIVDVAIGTVEELLDTLLILIYTNTKINSYISLYIDKHELSFEPESNLTDENDKFLLAILNTYKPKIEKTCWGAKLYFYFTYEDVLIQFPSARERLHLGTTLQDTLVKHHIA